ncbi:phosphofurin acidic cluster sorting protein 2 isoform X2 [Cydia pomonella]|uniref:phosphofurin acidic cluster sorting protein 2 isoform X2 n=1 Tax=Cydia pomonella TaxID=82600 RepID=UPI002ADE4095|nr:phosphofurin acidic cluster sorting protein 2 isoform X2 [Cydia pomonella]
MTEKNKSEKMTNTSKPVPMKLFAAWEVDRTPSNCIPRLCTLRVTRLRVCGALGEAGGGAAGGAGAGAVILAARMHSSKRTLRSNDIAVPPMDVELDLCFSLQYPHFVKRDGNRLQIMLQRRKKYKNRTILGYKTLAEGVIRMDQVLQRSMDMELELTGVGCKGGAAAGQPVARLSITGLASTPVDHDTKNNNNMLITGKYHTGVGCIGAAAGQPVARLSITGLASTPVDHDTKNNNNMLITERGYSDEEEEGEFSSVEEADEMTYGAPARRRTHRQLTFNKADLSYTKLSRSRDLSFMERERERQSYMRSKADRDSDSELENAAAKRKGSRGKLAQRNLKQKFAALLRRFRVPDEMGERGAARDTHHAQRDIDELFQELESLSCGEGEDSGPDQMDTISIGSTPKPSLRPFFSSSRSLANQDHHRHSNVSRHASLASTQLSERLAVTIPLTESEAIRSSAGDERGSEGNSDGDITADAPVSGASVSSSPPNETKVQEDKRSRLFRSATSGGNLTPAGATRKKNSLAASDRPLSAHELPVQSPTTQEPRRSMLEQISRLLGDDAPLPECVAVAPPGAAGALHALGVPTIVTPAPHAPDARPLLQALYARAGKQGVRRGCIRVVVAGGDGAAAAALRAHAELAARRPHDAPPIRFYIVPIGGVTVARHLAATDSAYGALFGDAWAACCDRAAEGSLPDQTEMSSRIARYLNSIGPVNNVPIGEAMVAYRERSGDEDASQTFVPFIAEVRVGCSEGGVSSLELEEGGSPPARPSPPATPAPLDLQPPLLAREPLELQLDYWLVSVVCVQLEEGGSPPARPSPPATPAPLDLQPPLLAREPLELQLDYWLVSVVCVQLEEGGSPPARPSPPATPAPLDLQPPLLAREPLELQLDYWLVSVVCVQLEEGGSPPARPSPPATPAPLDLQPPLLAREPLELQLDYWLVSVVCVQLEEGGSPPARPSPPATPAPLDLQPPLLAREPLELQLDYWLVSVVCVQLEEGGSPPARPSPPATPAPLDLQPPLLAREPLELQLDYWLVSVVCVQLEEGGSPPARPSPPATPAPLDLQPPLLAREPLELQLDYWLVSVVCVQLEEGGSPPARPSPPATPAPLDLQPPLLAREPLELQLDYWLVSVVCVQLEEGGSPPARPSPPATPAPLDLQPPLLAREPLELQLDYWLVSVVCVQLEEGGSPPARPSPPATPAPLDLQPPLLAREPLELQLDYWLVSVVCVQLEEGGSPPARPSPPATPAPLDLQPPLLAREPLELQLDYWLVPGRATEGADGKVTVKASFRALHVTRQNAHLCITYLTKEKKQKIMRLGKKKEKTGEAEPGRAQTVDGVARLICSAKGSHNLPLKVYIDGTEWNGVKFFQLSTQWQTHVKTFPVATCGAPLAPPET